MQMAFIKLHSFCVALHLRTCHTTSGWHCRTACQFLHRPNTKKTEIN